MRVLALEAATEACSVALIDGERVVERCEEAGRSASERLTQMVTEVLAEARLTLRDLDAVAASVGPGGFTGVRVTVSVAQGLAFGAGLPAVGVGTLEALALQARAELGRPLLCCLDARMNEVYWGVYEWGDDGLPLAIVPPTVSPPGEVRLPVSRAVGTGRGFSAYPQLASLPGVVLGPGADKALPRAVDVARLGRLRLARGAGLDPAALQPVYVRDKVALTEAERAAR